MAKQVNKKLFAVGKVYDTAVMTDNEIESSIQKDLDTYLGKDKVEFKLSMQGRTLAMFFHRQVDYDELHANPEEDIIDADALMITGEGYNGFKMPVPLPPMPFIGYIHYHLEQAEFLEEYKLSAQELGADKIKDIWMEINRESIALHLRL